MIKKLAKRKRKKGQTDQYDKDNTIRRHRADPSETGAIIRIAQHFRSSAGAVKTNIQDRKSRES